MGLEKRIGLSGAIGAPAWGAMMWGLAGIGWVPPTIAYYLAAIGGGVGVFIAAGVGLHVGWVWLRDKGLQLGPSIAVAICLVALVGSVIWGVATWKAPGKVAPEGKLHPPSLLTLYMTDTTRGDYINFDSLAELDVPGPSGNEKVRIFFTNVTAFDTNARFITFYIPASPETANIVDLVLSNIGVYLSADKAGIALRKFGSSSISRSSDAVFSGMVVIYHETMLSDQQTAALKSKFAPAGLKLDFRSLDYAQSIWSSIRDGDTKQPPDFEIRNNVPYEVGGKAADEAKVGDEFVMTPNSIKKLGPVKP